MKSNFIFTLNPAVGMRSTLRHLTARGVHGEQATHQLCESYKKPFVMIVKFKFYIALMAHGNFSYVKAQYDDFKKNVGGVAVARGQHTGQHAGARRESLADLQGGFKNQPQQLMFSSGFSEFHVEQQLAVNRYR